MKNDSIIQFLIRAKKATYAGNGAEASASRPKSHDFLYHENDCMYHDTYLGGSNFAGEEALWVKEQPYWSMNYCGRVTGDYFSIDFLKEALQNVPHDKPFRGPAEYSSKDYTYKCETSGDFEWFQGNEIIYFKGIKIYECRFHGGVLK